MMKRFWKYSVVDMILLTIILLSNPVLAEKKVYSIHDFQLGILYRIDGYYYETEEAFYAAAQNNSIGGLCFEETNRLFPGGTHFYYDDPFILEGVITSYEMEPPDESMNYPLFSYWDLDTGEKFVILWFRNSFNIIAPYLNFTINHIPDVANMNDLKAKDIRIEDIKKVNPLVIYGLPLFPNGIEYFYYNSIWYKNGKLALYSHLVSTKNGDHTVICSFENFILEWKLKDVLQQMDTFLKANS